MTASVMLAILAAWLLLCSLGWQIARGHIPIIGGEFRWPQVTAHERALTRFAAQVEPDTPGSVTTALYPHFSHRQKLYQFPHLADAEWVLLDVSGNTDMHPVTLRDEVQRMLSSGQWGVIDSYDGYLLLGRGEGNAEIDDAFYDFARAQGQQPQYSTDLTFGGSLRLLGYDLVDDTKWRLTSLRTYWQALGPLSADLRVYPFFVAADGSVVEDSTLRPPVAPLWYELQNWKQDEIVVVETLPWFLPRKWGLAVGVLQGEQWGQKKKRYRLSSAPLTATFEDNSWALLNIFERQGDMLQPIIEDTTAEPDIMLAGDFGGELSLLGHDGFAGTVNVGQSLPLTLYWQAQRAPALDYSIFVHLRDIAGNSTATQYDGQPAWYGPQLMSAWTPAQSNRSAATLHIAADVSPGDYRLLLGLYDWRTLDRLEIMGQDDQPLGNELELGYVRVLPKQLPSDLCCAMVSECCVSSPGRE